MKFNLLILFTILLLVLNAESQAQTYQFVREINGKTTAQTFAGFQQPAGIEFDTITGHIFVANKSLQVVQEFTPDYQFVKEYPAPDAVLRTNYLTRPTSIAVTSEAIYVVEEFTQLIKRISLKTGKVDLTFGGGGTDPGKFTTPYGIAASENGNIYISDYSQNTVQIFDKNGTYLKRIVPTNNAASNLNGPRGLAIDRDGNLLVADSRNFRIKKFSETGNFISSTDSVGYISPRTGFYSTDVAVDKAGNMYLGFADTARIVKLSPAGKVISSWAREGLKDDQFGRTFGFTLDNNLNIHLTDDGYNKVMKFSNSGQFLQKAGENLYTAADFYGLIDVAFDKSGNIWTVDQNINSYGRVIKFDNAGLYKQQWSVYQSMDGYALPISITVSDSGFVYIIDSSLNAVSKFEQNGKRLRDIYAYPFDTQLFMYPLDAAVDKSGNIYLSDPNRLRIYKMNAAGVKQGTIAEKVLKYPMGIEVDAAGNIYVADSLNGVIHKFSSTGNYIRKIGSYGNGNGQFIYPTDVAVDALGFVYVADPFNKRIQKFDSAGNFILQWKGIENTITELKYPARLDVNNDQIVIADLGAARIVLLEKLRPEPLFITGKDKLPRNIAAQYNVSPVIPGLIYKWFFTGTGVQLYHQDSSAAYVNMVAGKNAVKGDLVCVVKTANGDLYATIKKAVEITDPEEFYGIPECNCPAVYNKCSAEFIDRFEIGNLENSNTGCSQVGYTDYTTYGIKSELVIGENYNASFRLGKPAAGEQFVALWIDFNNDGDFEDQFEYLGGRSTSAEDLSINNIIIPAHLKYTGQARARVRTRTSRSFLADESCMIINESGETEDYIVMLKAPESLEAPQAITPNNDGLNDYFVIRGVNPEKSNSLVITDAMGNLIYEKDNYSNDWPSQEETAKLKKGTYYYHFKSGALSLKSYFMVNF
jgi:gliding motility-associated-like protein